MSQFFTELLAGFARIVVSGFVLWMVLVVGLLFKELFSPGDVNLRSYLLRVWSLFLNSFEMASYGWVLWSFYRLNSTDADLQYGISLTLSIIASVYFLYLRVTGKMLLKHRA
ncbi:hypothetical protein GCM10011571_13020 [Marinithermofilum abyssi]|uniref:Uncharacterized protein n=1 Tax=Marinithermofilum abyssi TaxID=1571185 RepID=A0A8J2VCR0_9BACL|nr:hypothetical protein [Marinithermofilum abyssi]GGE13036.1 hypothetical protein GCM10011571_13020 [Marinithermofilum abyssi]